jgi:hypothetical protein
MVSDHRTPAIEADTQDHILLDADARGSVVPILIVKLKGYSSFCSTAC